MSGGCLEVVFAVESKQKFRNSNKKLNKTYLGVIKLTQPKGGMVPGDPKKSIPLFGVSGEAQVFAKQLNIHIFG